MLISVISIDYSEALSWFDHAIQIRKLYGYASDWYHFVDTIGIVSDVRSISKSRTSYHNCFFEIRVQQRHILGNQLGILFMHVL